MPTRRATSSASAEPAEGSTPRAGPRSQGEIEWLPAVERDLRSQLEWIAEQHPCAAIDAGEAIITAVDRLADHPAMARPGRVRGTRELVVVGTPYIVVYRIEEGAVVVLRDLHSAQRWPRSVSS